MNVSQNINKLLYALSIRGKFYKIGSSKYYSDNKGKYVTLYYLYRKELEEKIFLDDDEEPKEKYVYKESFYSKIDLMKYLADELKEGEADGK